MSDARFHDFQKVDEPAGVIYRQTATLDRQKDTFDRQPTVIPDATSVIYGQKVTKGAW